MIVYRNYWFFHKPSTTILLILQNKKTTFGIKKLYVICISILFKATNINIII